jgi:uncharacterized protein (DUF58 family)
MPMTTTITADKKSGAETVHLAWTPQEAEEVRLALESSLADLSLEIRHTDRYEFREALKARRAVLQEALRRLNAIPALAPEGERPTEVQ